MIVALLIFFGLQIFSGWTILSSLKIKEKLSLWEIFAISYGIGMGLISIEIFFIFLFGFKISLWLLLLPWIILSGINIMKRQVLLPSLSYLPQKSLSKLERFLIIAISFEIIYAFFRAILYPMESYDSVAIWGLKAKAIYLAGGLSTNLFNETISTVHHWDYPLLIPIQEMLFYSIFKGINDALVKSIFPTYLLSFLIIFYSVLRRLFERKIALIFTFLLASLPQFNKFATNGYADFTMGFYYSIGFLFLYLWFVKEKRDFVFLSAIFSAIGAWTKNEGIPLCLLNFTLFLILTFSEVIRNKERFSDAVKAIFLYLALMGIFILHWQIFRISFGLKNKIFVEGVFSISRIINNLSRLPIIFYEYQKQFFNPKYWNMVWILFLISIILNFKKAFSKKFLLVTLSLIGIFGLYTAVYIITPLNLRWHLSTTASRLFIHFVAIVVFGLALIFEDRRFEMA